MKYSLYFRWLPNGAARTSALFFRTPWQRWPVSAHVSLAFLLVVIISATAWSAIRTADTTTRGRHDKYQAAQKQLLAIQESVRASPNTNFTNDLPPAARSDDVIRDMTRSAQALGVQISSLSVEPPRGSERELQRIHYQLSMTADYRAMRAWLAELLGRYPTLGIQNMTVRAQPNDQVRQETRVTLVFFVKN